MEDRLSRPGAGCIAGLLSYSRWLDIVRGNLSGGPEAMRGAGGLGDELGSRYD